MRKKEPFIGIDTSRWYSLSDLVDLDVFPFLDRDIRAYRNLIQADKRGKDHLKTLIRGKGPGTRYHVHGKHIPRFLAAIDEGRVRL